MEVAAPIGLDLETIAEQYLRKQGAPASAHEGAGLDAVEGNIRKHLGTGVTELEVARWLSKLARAMEQRHLFEAADSVRGRVNKLVSDELARIDGVR